MHEKTLLYGALGFTAIAAIVGVYKAKSDASTMAITPVSVVDQKGVQQAEVPVRLTASDGTGLELVALRAEAVVEDPLALTELHLTFENPEDRVLEGTFRITLPQGASLSRFAMKVGDAWQEGEVVEKQAARRAYEDFLHRKQDPALMEQGAGNEFSARVFPIPARGKKEIIVTYSQAVEAGEPYVLPLRGLPRLGTLDVNVHVAGTKGAEADGRTNALYGIHQRNVTPASDFVVDGKRIPRSPGLRSGELAIARVIPFASSRPEPLNHAIVLVDTSASRALGIADQARAVRDVLAKLPPDTTVHVACFDQNVEPVFDGRAGDFGDEQVAAIIERGALGASNFEEALDWAAEQAKKTKATRLVFVTDGVATAGETDAQKLRLKVESLREAGITRMDALAIGGIRDDGFLRTVTRGVLDRDGVVLDTKLGADALARRLQEATSSGVPVKVEGARWYWPQSLDGLQTGDEVLVYAELDGERPMKIDVGGQTFAPDLRTIDRPLVERAWAQAKIQSLIEAPTSSEAETKRQIVALSTRHRVLSPHTALLVLETDWDYRRFGIDRTAKVDILAVRDGRVAVVQSGRQWGDDTERKLEEAPSFGLVGRMPPSDDSANEPPGRWEESIPEGFGAESLGLSGVGQGGGGRGDGPGAGGASRGRAAAERAADAEEESARVRPAPRAMEPEPPAQRPARRVPPPPAPPPPPPGGSAAIGVVRPGTLSIESGISADQVQSVVRGAVPRLRACYQTELDSHSSTSGRLSISFVVAADGSVKSASVATPGSLTFRECVESVAKSLRFPVPVVNDARFSQTFDLVGGGSGSGGDDSLANIPKALPYEGRFKIVMDALRAGDKDRALKEARLWHAEQPGDVLSLVALGEAYEARSDLKAAARAYGSILELFSFRADSRRFAGERLERLDDPRALALAVDTYAKAAEQRPDHPASHRLYAFALLKKGEYEKAFEAIKKGATRTYPSGRFRGVDRILKEDMGLVAAAWTRAEPARAGEIQTKLTQAGGVAENGPSLRFVLVWETDANDVDFHIHDGKGGHAYYAQRRLPSGGELYADVTTGYGPECFTIRGPREQRAYPYTLQAHYYSRGPMGYGMGKLQVIEHDGKGNLSFDERPFVVMVDRAYVDMGKVEKTTKLVAAK